MWWNPWEKRGRRNVSPDIHDTYRRTPFSDRVKEVDSLLDLQSIDRSVARGLSRCVIKTSLGRSNGRSAVSIPEKRRETLDSAK